MAKVLYEKSDLARSARLGLNYLTSMVDQRHDYLPFWMIAAHENPAWARHCRVDDAELVASWYEGIVAVQQILETDEGAEVREAFRRHVLKSWGPKGLRYHENYPWTHTNHSSFHEMAYILSSLNRMLMVDADDREAERRAAGLVRGMRGLVIERKTRTFWSGDSPEPEAVYHFPNDVYLRDGGWDMTCHTGRGEQSIRNGMVLHPLVVRYDLTGDEVALDLATGIANYLLGTSRYFNHAMEFFGHVHSAMWVASGLVRLGRLTRTPHYVTCGKGIYDYVRSMSSAFGWVPEYAQWHPQSEEHCETCCIKDMIECAAELVDAGYPEYWTDLTLFSRNQLLENQITDGRFVAVDSTIPDTEDTTWRDIDRRVVGGWSGGAEPNSISLAKFRSIAGCCVGTAPQALLIAWQRAVDYGRKRLTVNSPIDRTTRHATVEQGYPNEGTLTVTPKRDCTVAIRLYPWMGRKIGATVGGRKRAVRPGDDGLAVFENVPAGTALELKHPLSTRKKSDHCMGRDWTGLWRGPDMIDMLPHGKPLRLWQREVGKKHVPRAPKQRTAGTGFTSTGPTQMKR